MRRVFVCVWLFVVAGCGPSAGAGAGEAQEPAPPVPVSPSVAGDEDPCAGRTGLLVEVPDVDATCEDEERFWPGSCAALLHVTVRNCGEAEAQIGAMNLDLGDEARIEWAFDESAVAPPAGTWEFESLQPLAAGDYTLEVHMRIGTQATFVEWVEFAVTNSAMVAAVAACEACDGDWGAHGMMGTVGCLCRTGDAGTPCDDGDDCEGQCISVDGAFECSEFFTVFGCHSYLPSGWSQQSHDGPAKAPTVCVD